MGVESLQRALEEFGRELGGCLVATGVVNLDGGLEAYVPAKERFRPQRASSVFALVVNVLNKSLDEIYQTDLVKELLVIAENSYFLLRMLGREHFHGLVASKEADLERTRRLMQEYEPKLLRALGE